MKSFAGERTIKAKNELIRFSIYYSGCKQSNLSTL